MEKKLTKSTSDKKIMGVCGGIAKYYNLDPNVVRIATLVICLFTGVGLVAYLIAGFILPEGE